MDTKEKEKVRTTTTTGGVQQAGSIEEVGATGALGQQGAEADAIAVQPGPVLPPPGPIAPPDPDPEAKKPPVINSVSPNSSSTNGGTTVTIKGDNFKPGSTVQFGTAAAASMRTSANGRNITAVTPPHPAGNVMVRVTNPSGLMASIAHAFTFVQAPAPMVDGLNRDHGPSSGNYNVDLFGANFVQGSQVIFGGGTGRPIFWDSNTLRLTVPPGTPGAIVQVGAINPDGQVSPKFTIFRYDE